MYVCMYVLYIFLYLHLTFPSLPSPSTTNPYESLVLSVLGNLLVEGPASPLYQALLDADIGADFSPVTG